MHINRISRIIVISLVVDASVSCTTSEERARQGSQATQTGSQPIDAGEAEPKELDGLLPIDLVESPETQKFSDFPPEAVPDTFFGEVECLVWLPPADACAWAAQADAIVLARVTSFQLVDRPAVGAGPDGHYEVSECSYANPAMTIGLRIEQTLSGSVEGDIVLMVGWEQVERFDPMPFQDGNGPIEWMGLSKNPLRGPLFQNQQIIVGIHKISVGWSLMGDTILGVTADGKVRAVERPADCLSTTPIDVDMLDIEAVAAKMRCEADVADTNARRAARNAWWGEDKTAINTHAAFCLDPSPEPPFEMPPESAESEEVPISPVP